MTKNRVPDTKELYIIIRCLDGHIRRYASDTAVMHCDIINQYDIDLDAIIILEKGFIINHKITITYNIRNPGDRL